MGAQSQAIHQAGDGETWRAGVDLGRLPYRGSERLAITGQTRRNAAWPHRQSKEPGRFARLVLACPVRQPHRRRSGTILRWIYITIAKLSSSRCSTSIEHPDSSTRVAASI